MDQRKKISPPKIAKAWGLDPNKIIGWIKSGELRAINVATTAGGRPRFLVDEADLAEFEARRAVSPPPAATPRRRRSAGDVKEFF